ncbi:MAG TPA: hypothetical protein DCW68_06940 [Rhodospirillaceae bacterium]|nr:hypothetical protein [Rhodospirillaceae bacterium]
MHSAAITQERVAGAVSTALLHAFRDRRHAAKEIGRQVGRDPRAVKNWLGGRCPPRAAELIELMSQFGEVYDAVMALAGRKGFQPTDDERKRIDEAIRILRG